MPSPPWLRSSSTQAAISLVLGLIVGIAISTSGSPTGRSIASALDPIGAMWVNGIRMTVVPLVVSLIVSTLADTRLKSIGTLSARAIALFVVMLTAVSTLGAILAPPLMNMLQVDPASAASLRSAAASTKQPDLPGFASWLVGLVPANPIKAAADGAMLPLIVFAVIFALALARAPENIRAPATSFFRAVADTMLVIVQWVLALAPIGVFALIVSLAVQIGASVAGAVAFYVVVHSALLVVVALLLYVVVRVAGGIPVPLFARAALPAQVVAVTARSSLAALPAMIDGAKRVLWIPEEVASFALPFGVSLLRLNTCMSWIVGGLFIAKLYGVPLGAREIIIIAAAGVPMSFSVPGIPSGGLFVLAPLFIAVNLPLEGIGILIALDAIPDMFKTLVNVTGHLTATTILARRPVLTEST